jgi:hypothetical protein
MQLTVYSRMVQSTISDILDSSTITHNLVHRKLLSRSNPYALGAWVPLRYQDRIPVKLPPATRDPQHSIAVECLDFRRSFGLASTNVQCFNVIHHPELARRARSPPLELGHPPTRREYASRLIALLVMAGG